jgi:hypothetical protein
VGAKSISHFLKRMGFLGKRRQDLSMYCIESTSKFNFQEIVHIGGTFVPHGINELKQDFGVKN